MNSKQFFYEFGKLIYEIDGFYAEYAKEVGVKENLLWILYALNDGAEHSQKEICDSWDLPRTTVNTIVKEMEADGYIHLVQIKGEKRELNVKLSDSGKEYADHLLKDLYLIENKCYELINDSDVIDKMKEVLTSLEKSKVDVVNKLKGEIE